MSYEIILGRNSSDKKAFGNKGLTFLGKGYVKMGQQTSLSNTILMDIARSHVVLVAGKRGSGKSYTLGVIAEELSSLAGGISKNIASIIFDTMGIYWTMKYPNEKDKELLREWGLSPKSLPVKIFIPSGYYDNYLIEGIPGDKPFALDITELNAEDWILTFNLNMTNPVAVLIQRTFNKLKQTNEYFNLDRIIKEIEKDEKNSQETINAAVGLFESAQTWGIFAKEKYQSTKINDLINAGTTTVIDLSPYNSVGAFNVRGLVISLVSRKIFNSRMEARRKEEIKSISRGLDYSRFEEKKEEPLVWIFVDEAHEFLPMNEKTVATDALVQLLREGRQPGVSLVLATQQPGKIHTDVMTQSDIVISHRVTSSEDLAALNHIMQSYLFEGIKKYMDELPTSKGSAIILDDNSERIYPLRIRPRFTWHGGEAPMAVNPDKKI